MHQPIVLGCDPEIIFEKEGYKLDANDVLPNRECGFGCDGHPATAEIRPGYSDSLLELIAKIERTMQIGDRKLGLNKATDRWLCGHYKHREPIGGHIHIAKKGIGRSYKQEAAILDYYLEDCLEDLIAPAEERFLRITNTGNGVKYNSGENGNAIRKKDDNRIEYRAPGSWLLCPSVSLAYLYTAKAALTLLSDGHKLRNLAIDTSTKSARIAALKDLNDRIRAGKPARDMVIGSEVLEEVLGETDYDWDTDIRSEWL